MDPQHNFLGYPIATDQAVAASFAMNDNSESSGGKFRGDNNNNNINNNNRATAKAAAAAVVVTVMVKDGNGNDTVVPSEYVCPITNALMQDPYMTRSGLSYEREAICDWLATGCGRCPVTGDPLRAGMLLPNYALKMQIAGWCVRFNIQHHPSMNSNVKDEDGGNNLEVVDDNNNNDDDDDDNENRENGGWKRSCLDFFSVHIPGEDEIDTSYTPTERSYPEGMVNVSLHGRDVGSERGHIDSDDMNFIPSSSLSQHVNEMTNEIIPALHSMARITASSEQRPWDNNIQPLHSHHHHHQTTNVVVVPFIRKKGVPTMRLIANMPTYVARSAISRVWGNANKLTKNHWRIKTRSRIENEPQDGKLQHVVSKGGGGGNKHDQKIDDTRRRDGKKKRKNHLTKKSRSEQSIFHDEPPILSPSSSSSKPRRRNISDSRNNSSSKHIKLKVTRKLLSTMTSSRNGNQFLKNICHHPSRADLVAK